MKEIRNTLQDNNGEFVLMRNGKQSCCHLKNPMPIMQQTALGRGELQIIQMPCSSICPKFHIKNEDGKTVVHHTCNYEMDHYDIDQDDSQTNLFPSIQKI